MISRRLNRKGFRAEGKEGAGPLKKENLKMHHCIIENIMREGKWGRGRTVAVRRKSASHQWSFALEQKEEEKKIRR